MPKKLKYLLYNLRNKLNGALALISGRMVQDIQNIINPLKLSVSGIHGLEYTNNHGQYLRNNIEPIPSDIYKRLYTFSKNYPGSMIEKKNISVPFKAITSFTDPSVGFGLQFKIEDNLKNTSLSKIESSDINKPAITNLDDADLKSGEIVSLDEFRDKK